MATHESHEAKTLILVIVTLSLVFSAKYFFDKKFIQGISKIGGYILAWLALIIIVGIFISYRMRQYTSKDWYAMYE